MNIYHDMTQERRTEKKTLIQQAKNLNTTENRHNKVARQRFIMEYEGTESQFVGQLSSETITLSKNFGIQISISGKAKCRKCELTITKGGVRMYQYVYNSKLHYF